MSWLLEVRNAAVLGSEEEEGALSWLGAEVKEAPVTNVHENEAGLAAHGGLPTDDHGTPFKRIGPRPKAPPRCSGQIHVDYPSAKIAQNDLVLGGGNGSPVYLFKSGGAGEGTGKLRQGLQLVSVNGDTETFQARALRRVLAVDDPVHLVFQDMDAVPIQCDEWRLLVTNKGMGPSGRLILVPVWTKCFSDFSNRFSRILHVDGKEMRIPMTTRGVEIASTIKRFLPRNMLGLPDDNPRFNCQFDLTVPLIALRQPTITEETQVSGNNALLAAEVCYGMRLQGFLRCEALAQNAAADRARGGISEKSVSKPQEGSHVEDESVPEPSNSNEGKQSVLPSKPKGKNLDGGPYASNLLNHASEGNAVAPETPKSSRSGKKKPNPKDRISQPLNLPPVEHSSNDNMSLPSVRSCPDVTKLPAVQKDGGRKRSSTSRERHKYGTSFGGESETDNEEQRRGDEKLCSNPNTPRQKRQSQRNQRSKGNQSKSDESMELSSLSPRGSLPRSDNAAENPPKKSSIAFAAAQKPEAAEGNHDFNGAAVSAVMHKSAPSTPKDFKPKQISFASVGRAAMTASKFKAAAGPCFKILSFEWDGFIAACTSGGGTIFKDPTLFAEKQPQRISMEETCNDNAEASNKGKNIKSKTFEELLMDMDTWLCTLLPSCWDPLAVHPEPPMAMFNDEVTCVECAGPLRTTPLQESSLLINSYWECSRCGCKSCQLAYCVFCDIVEGLCSECFGCCTGVIDSICYVRSALGHELDDIMGSASSRRQLLRRRTRALAEVLHVHPQQIVLSAEKDGDTWRLSVTLLVSELGIPVHYSKTFSRSPSPLVLFMELRERCKAGHKEWPLEGMSWLGSGPLNISELVLMGSEDLARLAESLGNQESMSIVAEVKEATERIYPLFAKDVTHQHDVRRMNFSEFAFLQASILAKLTGGDGLDLEYADVVLGAVFTYSGGGKKDQGSTINPEQCFEAQEEIYDVLCFEHEDVLQALKEVEVERIEMEKAMAKAKKDAKDKKEVMRLVKVPVKDLIKAIREDNFAEVKLFLLRGANVNGKHDGESPLHVAAQGENVDIPNYLLSFNADPNHLNDEGEAPLDITGGNLVSDAPGSVGITNILLKFKAELHGSRDTALFRAIRKSASPETCIPLLVRGFANVKAVDGRSRSCVDIAWESRSGLKTLQALNTAEAKFKQLVQSAFFDCLDDEVRRDDESTVTVLLELNASLTSEDEKQTAIHYAVEKCSSLGVIGVIARRGFQDGVLDKLDENGSTPLDLAVSITRWEVVKVLVESGAHLDAKREDALFSVLTLREMGLELAELLLRASASPNGQNEQGHRPLTLLAEQGNLPMTQLVIEKAIEIVDLKQTDRLNNTALHIAAFKCDLEIVMLVARFTKEFGISLNLDNYRGFTPMDLSLQRFFEESPPPMSSETIRFLADLGALPKKNKKGAFFAALYLQDVKAIKAMLRVGIDLNQTTIDKYGSFAVHAAATFETTEIMNLLMKNHADVSKKKLFDGDCALHIACRRGHAALVQTILNNTKEPSLENAASETPLDLAVQSKSKEVAQLLMDHKGKLGSFSKNSILCSCILEFHDDTWWLKLALDGGADIAAEQESCAVAPFHHTPLHLAAWRGSGNSVRMLLIKKAEIGWKNREDRTALHYAMPPCVELLLNARSEVNCRDRGLHTPLMAMLLLHNDKEAAECARLLWEYHHSSAHHDRPHLEFGLNITGETVFHLCAKRGLHGCSMFLMKNTPLDRRAKNNEGLTPADCGRQEGHITVADLLS